MNGRRGHRVMSQPATQPTGFLARIQDRAEETIYRLNEQDHWIFRVYDLANEIFAALRFRGVRRRAAAIDVPLRASDGVEARLRFLTPADDEPFADLLARLTAVRYRPPHPLDRAAALRALRRRSTCLSGCSSTAVSSATCCSVSSCPGAW